MNNMVDESASFVVIMLLHEGLTHIHSQKKPRLHSGDSFSLGVERLNVATPSHPLKIDLTLCIEVNGEALKPLFITKC